MLYLTTRDRMDAFTPQHALTKNTGKCGGRFLPYRLPVLTKQQLMELPEKSFGQRVAEVLSLFFRSHLNGWDIDFAVGRHPVRLCAMNHKIAVMESWHNHEGTFQSMVDRLYRCVNESALYSEYPGVWFRIAARIAVLSGSFSELIKAGIAADEKPVDIAVPVNDFEGVMAAWYSRKMGLPVGTIIFSCNENSNVWDFLHHGILDTKEKTQQTSTPDSDRAVPQSLELLIYETLGYEETQRFVQCCQAQKTYTIRSDQLSVLSNGLFCAVIRQPRLESIVRNVFKTNSYLMDPYTALAYGGLQDYRVASAEIGPALIVSDQNPLTEMPAMERILGVTAAEIQKIMDAR